MIYNIIPINYPGGLGGQFLATFLRAAHKSTPTNWIFSEDGNAHDSEKDYSPTPYGMGKDSSGKLNISFLIEYAKTIPEDSVVYSHGHFPDPDLLMKYVHKQIKIYAEPEQVDEAVGVFMLKNPNTKGAFQNLIKPVMRENYMKHPLVVWRKYALNKFTRFYNKCPDLEPRMLNVSWNDMLYNDPEILISKLHEFTQIPKENFDREKFNEWRMLTHKTVNRLREAGLI